MQHVELASENAPLEQFLKATSTKLTQKNVQNAVLVPTFARLVQSALNNDFQSLHKKENERTPKTESFLFFSAENLRKNSKNTSNNPLSISNIKKNKEIIAKIKKILVLLHPENEKKII